MTTVDRKAQGATRRSILHLLRRRTQMTATELSEELNIGAVGVRQHLALLERDGLVEVAGLRRSVGRPSHLYTLTPEAERFFPKNYDALVLNVLDYIAERNGQDLVFEALDAQSRERIEGYTARIQGHTPAERLAELVNILNEEGFMCDYEQQPDGSYLLTKHNCPIDCVARHYPQMCDREIEFYQQLLGVPVTLDTTIASDGTYCRYHIAA